MEDKYTARQREQRETGPGELLNVKDLTLEEKEYKLTGRDVNHGNHGDHRPILKEDDPRMEDELVEELRKGSRTDKERDAGILKDLGWCYSKRGSRLNRGEQFVYASALFNAAYIRTKDRALQSELDKLIRKNELAFCDALGVTAQKLPSDSISDIRRQLDDIRKETRKKCNSLMEVSKSVFREGISDEGRIDKEEGFIKATQNLFAEVCQERIEFLQMLLSRSKEILGLPPQDYAALGLGSLARGDVTPYSDVEWAMLIQDETKDVQYFRNLARTVHLYVLNIRETVLHTMNIKSLNDYDDKSEDGFWFEDIVTPRGFSFDSSAPFACDTPLGRPERPGKEGNELIKTPINMAQFCEENYARKEGYHMDRVMYTTVKLDGGKNADRLIDEFVTERKKLRETESTVQHTFEEIKEVIEKFFPKLSFHDEDSGTVHDVKQDVFRLPTLVLNLFKTLFCLDKNNTWEVLDEMRKNMELTEVGAHNFKCVNSIATLHRLAIYSEEGCQNELMSLLSGENNSEYLSASKPMILRYYKTMLPFVDFIRNTNEVSVFKAKIKDQSFYETNGYISGLIEKLSNALPDAREKFISHIEMVAKKHADTSNSITIEYEGRDVNCVVGGDKVLSCVFQVAETYYREGKFDVALSYYNIIKEMCKRLHGDSDNEDKAELLNNLGIVYEEIGDLHSALQHKMEGLAIRTRMHNGSDHPKIAESLHNIGFLYKRMDLLSFALRSMKGGFEMWARLYSKTNHPHIATSLNNIGLVYQEMGDLASALQYYKDALGMWRKLHGDRDHSEIATSLNNVGFVYHGIGKHELALQHYTHALEMSRRVYGNRDHPYIAVFLDNIGRLYDEMALKFTTESSEMRTRLNMS